MTDQRTDSEISNLDSEVSDHDSEVSDLDSEGASPWLFLLGLVLFLGSAALFVLDLVRGVDVFRSIAANAVAAVLLIGWAALDTIRDPESAVETVAGATGTALLLYGLYLLGTGVAIAATGLFAHEYTAIGLLYLGLALVSAVVGYLIFPVGAFLEEGGSGEEESGPSEEETGRSHGDSDG